MMTRRRRIILFWISTLVFILALFPILLYSFGFRFNIKEFKLSRAGGIYISSVPSLETKIYIDNRLVKETSLLSRSFFQQGLTPRTYSIRIEKEGYQTWRKDLEVEPEKVLAIRALLVKASPDEAKVLLRGEYNNLFFNNDQENIIVLTLNDGTKHQYSITSNSLVSPVNITATTSPEFPQDIKDFIAAKNPTGVDYDPSRDRLLWWDDHSIHIKWLRGNNYLPLYTNSDEIEIIRTDHNIRDAMFYPGQEAIIAAYANAINIIELDGRESRNIFSLYKGREPIFDVSQSEKIVYFLDDGDLISIPLL